jgi:hypothetical protein
MFVVLARHTQLPLNRSMFASLHFTVITIQASCPTWFGCKYHLFGINSRLKYTHNQRTSADYDTKWNTNVIRRIKMGKFHSKHGKIE